MKSLYFYLLSGALAALQYGAILTGFLPPLSTYSPIQIGFSIVTIMTVTYMGWSNETPSVKGAAVKGVIYSLTANAVLSVATAIGYAARRPVLGVAVQSVYYLPVVLLIITAFSAIVCAIFAVLGAVIARRSRMLKAR